MTLWGCEHVEISQLKKPHLYWICLQYIDKAIHLLQFIIIHSDLQSCISVGHYLVFFVMIFVFSSFAANSTQCVSSLSWVCDIASRRISYALL